MYPEYMIDNSGSRGREAQTSWDVCTHQHTHTHTHIDNSGSRGRDNSVHEEMLGMDNSEKARIAR